MSNRAVSRSSDIRSEQPVQPATYPYDARKNFVFDGVIYDLDRSLAPCLTDSEYARVCGILMQNVANQRAARVINHYFSGPVDGWQQYQLRVVDTFFTEHALYDALQECNVDAWQVLAGQLTQAAQRLLLRNGTCLQYARDQAAEMSQQACERIFAATYPWDIPLQLWTSTIVRNIFLQRYTRSHDLMDRDVWIGEDLEFDETYECTNTLPLTSPQAYPTVKHEQNLVDANDLIEALEQMQSVQRRAVILYTYYEEYSDEEIAQAIGKTRNAVHTLRHRALRQLRTLLGV